MNLKNTTVTSFIALAVLAFGFQTAQAHQQEGITKEKPHHVKSFKSKVASLKMKCREKSARDPYATYRVDLKSMTCVKKSMTAKAICPDGYHLFKRRCIKGSLNKSHKIM